LDKPEVKNKLLVVGTDSRLSYLLNRYADQCGMTIAETPVLPPMVEIQETNPSAIIFQSLDALRESHAWIIGFSDLDIQIFVCVAVAEEAAARELGADDCLFHPLTYEGFCRSFQ